jgi:uncharacterized protein YjiS (DUF1127 family)
MLEQYANSLVAYWMQRAATEHQQLADRELQDIGLSRCRIEAAAHGFEQPDAKRGPTRWTRTVS